MGVKQEQVEKFFPLAFYSRRVLVVPEAKFSRYRAVCKRSILCSVRCPQRTTGLEFGCAEDSALYSGMIELMRECRILSLQFSSPAWRNWQTRWTQNPVIARSCGFEPLRRQSLIRYWMFDVRRSMFYRREWFGCPPVEPGINA